MDINLADVTLHVDEELNQEQRGVLEEQLRARDGVVSVHVNEQRPHLWILEYNPEKVHGKDLLDIVRSKGLHGELVGL